MYRAERCHQQPSSANSSASSIISEGPLDPYFSPPTSSAATTAPSSPEVQPACLQLTEESKPCPARPLGQAETTLDSVRLRKSSASDKEVSNEYNSIYDPSCFASSSSNAGLGAGGIRLGSIRRSRTEQGKLEDGAKSMLTANLLSGR